MKFWRHVNLAIFEKNPYVTKFWNISHLIFVIPQTETLVNWGIQNFYDFFLVKFVKHFI